MASYRHPGQTRAGRRPDAGFTLIELLIVVVIIGILAAIAIPQFSVTKAKAGDATATSDLRNLMTAQEEYFNDHQAYTDQLSDLRAEGFSPSARVSASVALRNGGSTYDADASHGASTRCYRVSYGGPSQAGVIEMVPNAASGNGDCSG